MHERPCKITKKLLSLQKKAIDTLNLDLTKRYTYADYLTWFDDVRRELIDGFIHILPSSHRTVHQQVSGSLSARIANFLHKKKPEVYFAPFDVRLYKGTDKEHNSVYTVIQPDICVICDPAKLDELGCVGTPDLIIEILTKTL